MGYARRSVPHADDCRRSQRGSDFQTFVLSVGLCASHMGPLSRPPFSLSLQSIKGREIYRQPARQSVMWGNPPMACDFAGISWDKNPFKINAIVQNYRITPRRRAPPLPLYASFSAGDSLPSVGSGEGSGRKTAPVPVPGSTRPGGPLPPVRFPFLYVPIQFDASCYPARHAMTDPHGSGRCNEEKGAATGDARGLGAGGPGQRLDARLEACRRPPATGKFEPFGLARAAENGRPARARALHRSVDPGRGRQAPR